MMVDLSQTISPRSDQLNADDLWVEPITITISRVTAPGGEQPISIFYEGDNGKPYKPCLSMRRLLVHAWGKDGNDYVGRSMTLFRDPKVRFGAAEAGGIRISHLSHINEPMTVALAESRKTRKPFTVRPLVMEQKRDAVDEKQVAKAVTDLISRLDICKTEDEVDAILTAKKVKQQREWVLLNMKAESERLEVAIAKTFNRIQGCPSTIEPPTGVAMEEEGKEP